MNNKGGVIEIGKCYTIRQNNYIIHTFGVEGDTGKTNNGL